MVNISKKIASVEFDLLSPKEIREMSAIKVITPDTYDEDGFPIVNGLMDPRLGVIDPGLVCVTCGKKVPECPGHFGHIDLAMPVIHVGYVKVLRNILRSTCRKCGRILLTKQQMEHFDRRMAVLIKEGKNVKPLITNIVKTASAADACPHCGEHSGKIDIDKPTTFRYDDHKLTQADVREWLEKAPAEDLKYFNFAAKIRPEWMILTVLPVPPVTTRPSITLPTGERSEDDLTHKLVDIIRLNQRLQENRDAGAPQLIVEDLWELLQYHITTYFDNQTAGIPPARHRSGRALKTLAQRLKGKEGRFRSNLSGKRVNFSARTVVSPDPNISMTEVGVPAEIARELTVPVKVTADNIEWAKEMVKRGPEPVPPKGTFYVSGVSYVIRTDQRRLRVTDKSKDEVAEKVEAGFIIERQLEEGDVVLFNRQPSLHRMSMMAHTVRIMPGKTFRINLVVCPPYNADFDGDEMNMHVLQSEEARAEAHTIMKTQEHILSPRFGGPVIGGIHDHITGGFLFTHGDQGFDKAETLFILSRIGFTGELPEPKGKGGRWTGKQIFSTILPKDMNLEFKSEICEKCDKCTKEQCQNDAYVVIKDGELLKGTIDEKAIGAFKGVILDRIAKDYGNDMARQFLDDVTRLCIGAITLRGFTISISDEDIPEEAKDQIKKMLEEAVHNVNKHVEAYNKGELEQMPGRSIEETLEINIMRVLGRARDGAGKIAGKYLGIDNSAVMMAKSGARGSMLNLSQMAGCIGQQAIRGERIHRGYQKRTLPHFKPGDVGAEAKGFVKSCYKSGLTPTEYFFHSAGGREGLVDTAVRTSRSGYMQRRLINALADLKVDEDSTVKDTAETVIQFAYGDDSVDPTKSERGKAINFEAIIKEVLGKAKVEELAEMQKKEEDVELMRSIQDDISTEGVEKEEIEEDDEQ
ncbi:MAG: DNA-directed RNA polymerase subunit A' [Thermoplasmata archaeon HGW-Thermoplasmata-2]|nr:MAG: DNA-directed RNA polymerase subunit A' [Thermoplasmata archaeon HGW-Thermoplasmata-2]